MATESDVLCVVKHRNVMLHFRMQALKNPPLCSSIESSHLQNQEGDPPFYPFFLTWQNPSRGASTLLLHLLHSCWWRRRTPPPPRCAGPRGCVRGSGRDHDHDHDHDRDCWGGAPPLGWGGRGCARGWCSVNWAMPPIHCCVSQLYLRSVLHCKKNNDFPVPQLGCH